MDAKLWSDMFHLGVPVIEKVLRAVFVYFFLVIGLRLAGKRVGDDGFLTILARSRRTQDANRREAIERLVELVQRATEKPKPRRATRPTAASQKRRLEAKRRRGATKQGRQSQGPSEE